MDDCRRNMGHNVYYLSGDHGDFCGYVSPRKPHGFKPLGFGQIVSNGNEVGKH